jgi:hypothetical protein
VTGPLPISHVLCHVRDALAADERVGELGLDVTVEVDPEAVDAEVVVVRGAVSTEDRKAGVLVVALEVLVANGVDRPIRDETEVPSHLGPGEEVEAL